MKNESALFPSGGMFLVKANLAKMKYLKLIFI
jgi:hypothetical protein